MRRGQARKNALTSFKVMLNNVRGFKSKAVMIKRIIEEEQPVIVALVETKLNKKEPVDIPGYKINRVDRDCEGGGVLMGYRKSMRNVVICTAETRMHNAEMLWQRLDNGKIKMKIGVIYMPQESQTSLLKLKEI